jgi:hypothetical protein
LAFFEAEPENTRLPDGRFRQLYFGKKPKIEFSLFHPTFIHQPTDDISPEIQGRIYGTPRQSLKEFFD